MSKIDTEYLNELVERYSAYKSPTETQQLIVALGQKSERTKEDNKNLNVLLKAEKKAEQLHKARAEARKLLNAEKEKERKARNRRLIIWGAALTKASENDIEINRVMQKLFNEGYISKGDKEIVKSDLKSKQQSDNQTIQQPIQSIHQLANFNNK